MGTLVSYPSHNVMIVRIKLDNMRVAVLVLFSFLFGQVLWDKQSSYIGLYSVFYFFYFVFGHMQHVGS